MNKKRRPDAARGLAIREPVRYFAALMESRLRERDSDRGKRGWIGCDRDWLLCRVFFELGEVMYAVARRNVGEGQAEDLAEECADAANFLMMIADQHRPRNYAVSRARRKGGSK